jgi:hemerythrin
LVSASYLKTGKNTIDESHTKCVNGVNGEEKNVYAVANFMDLTNKLKRQEALKEARVNWGRDSACTG